ncbi:MAG: thioredoxin [Acidobacteria bacterium]|nr:thioredoxin [Acidobacteriota bacterium]
MSGSIVELTDGTFKNEVLASDIPVLVDFWAPWCAPCRMLSPTIEALADDYQGRAVVGKMNVDENNITPGNYKVQGIPTLILFKAGVEQERLVGATSKDNIARMINKHLDVPSSKLG